MEIIKFNKAIVYSGGSITGITYAGVLKYLEKIGGRDQYNYHVGSSIGSAFAALIACGITYKKMWSEIINKDFTEFVTNDYGALEGLPRLLCSYGWYDNNKFAEWINKLLAEVTGIKNITFADIKNKFNKNVVITTYSCNKGETLYYAANTNPDMPVWEAIRRSTALPFIFELVRGDNDYYSDGGLLDNMPVDYCIKNNIDYVALKLVRKKIIIPLGKPANLYEMAKLVIILLREQSLRKHISEDIWKKTIPINIDGFNIIEFNLTQLQKDDLINRGYNAVEGKI